MSKSLSLFMKDSNGFDLSWLPDAYKKLPKSSTVHSFHVKAGHENDPILLNSYIVNALHNYALDSGSEIGLVQISDGMADGSQPAYASEMKFGGFGKLLSYASGNGTLNISIVDNGKYSKIPPIGNKNDRFDASSLLLIYLCIEADKNKKEGREDNAWTWGKMQAARDDVAAQGFVRDELLRLANATLFEAFEDENPETALVGNIMAGNSIALLSKARVENCEFVSGKILAGDPEILKPAEFRNVRNTTGPRTIGDLKKDPVIAEYVQSLHWEPEEELLIQKFPDSTVVPEQIEKTVYRFILSLKGNYANPFVNFSWRGITGFGKSTGVAMMSAILHTPLVWLTCSSSTDREYFLSSFVPEGRKEYLNNILPTFDDIMMDPVAAYEKLTGEIKSDVTEQAILEAYGRAYAKAAQSTPSYKLVESDFVTALVRGYIVEIQEYSRIRDSGVLTALNNLDRPGCVIPMADGSKKVRHRNAITFWTDNSGYVSCRPVDPSVKRRLDAVYNSFKMEKELAIARIQQNLPDFKDYKLLDKLYTIWSRLVQYCKEHEITDGDISIVELERWCALVQMEGTADLEATCYETIIGKAADDEDGQNELLDFLRLELAKMN